ncbi:MAG: phosphoglycerate transporter [Dehalococcoidia bacterium]|nr:phosphoglycerate transporter [Dehalococcoidia bacterium]
MTIKIAWFSTGSGFGSRNLLEATYSSITQDNLSLDIECVFSNREEGEHSGSDQFFSLVHSLNIPLLTHSSNRFYASKEKNKETRTRFDQGVIKKLSAFSPDLVIFAGYKLIVSKELCDYFTIINLHPALPSGPTGTWQDVIWQLIQSKSTHTGATIHQVTEYLDQGPPITYFKIPIHTDSFAPLWKEIDGKTIEDIRLHDGEDNALFKAIRESGLKREGHLIVESLRYIAKNPTILTTLANGNLAKPISLTEVIESMV